VTLTSATVSGGTGSITVNANGTQGDVDLGDLQAKSVTVNAAGALGTVDVDVTAETATVTGSELKVNTIDVTASKSATVTGGIAEDVITVTGNADAGAKAIFTLTGGLGADEFVITSGSGATVVSITDFALGSDDVAGVTVDNLGAIEAADAKAVLESAFGGTFVKENITIVDLGNSQNAVVYGGSTYLITGNADGTLDDGEIVIKLTGVDVSGDVTAADVFA
jgi:hypothetical protein